MFTHSKPPATCSGCIRTDVVSFVTEASCLMIERFTFKHLYSLESTVGDGFLLMIGGVVDMHKLETDSHDRLMREVEIMRRRFCHPNIIRLVEALDTPKPVCELSLLFLTRTCLFVV